MNFWLTGIFLSATLIRGRDAEKNLDFDFMDLGSGDNETSDGVSKNCTNDYCISDEAYIDLIADYLVPKNWGWVLIALHTMVFFGGIVGNFLVCIAVHRNHSMRTVTNYFIVNLAVADLMVIIFCLPSTVLWDLTETWFLGDHLCKAILYIQTVSVSVSILTLTFISVDRWYAICLPLEFKSTTSRAKRAILLIWIFSLFFDIPDLVVLHVKPASHLKVKTIFYTQCTTSWSENSEKIFTAIKLICLYFGPLAFMSFAYCMIIRVLWKSEIPGYKPSRNVSAVTELTSSVHESLEGQLMSRKKAAKMLVAVVLVFGICYFPVHLLTILRQYMGLPSNDTTVAFSLLAHWLCYANSAVNPIIYNFMSGKFRKEFRRSFMCTPERSAYRDSPYNKFTAPTLPPDHRSQAYKNMQIDINFERIPQCSELIPLSPRSSSRPSTQSSK